MSLNIDPFDIEWSASDPRDRSVYMLKAIRESREAVGKHQGEEYLAADDVRDVISDPDRIDLTQRPPEHREIFYKENEDSSYRYSRAVVKFEDDEGIVISWSKYRNHVSSVDIVYQKPESEK